MLSASLRMPLTLLAHQAAVFPFKTAAPRGLDGVALVMGSIVPDLAYAVLPWVRIYSHNFASILWFSLPVGWLIARDLRNITPRLLAALDGTLGIAWPRLQRSSPEQRTAVTTTFCLLLGALTHVIWDGISHPEPTFVDRWSPYPLTAALTGPAVELRMVWLSRASSIFGAAYSYLWLQRTSANAARAAGAPPSPRHPERNAVGAALGGGFAVGCAIGNRYFASSGIQCTFQWGLILAYLALRVYLVLAPPQTPAGA
jgi:Domain of unknown function (DUF4184)